MSASIGRLLEGELVPLSFFTCVALALCKAARMRLTFSLHVRLSSALCLAVLVVFAACGCRRAVVEGSPVVRLSGGSSQAQALGLPAGASATGTSGDSPKLPPPSSLSAARTQLAPFFYGSAARAAFDADRYGEAADGFAAWGSAHPKDPDLDRARFMWHFSEYRAGRYRAAAAGLWALAKKGGVIGRHSRLWAAEAAIAAGDAAMALKILDGGAFSGFVRRDRVLFLRARSAEILGDKALKLQSWRELVRQPASQPAGILLSAAEALQEENERAEAAKLLRKVWARYPGTRSARRAHEALSELPAAMRSPSEEEWAERASRAAALHAREESLVAAGEVIRLAKKGTRRWCDAALVRAKVTETFFKRRSDAVKLYDLAVEGCPRRARNAPIWYRAAKRHNFSGDRSRALRLFKRVRERAPKSSLVDDAARWQARILRGGGRDRQANALLQEIVGMKGDMAQYAAWDLLWNYYRQRHWKKAAGVARRALSRGISPGRVFNAGRFGYWLGMAERKQGASGLKRAIAAWSEVVAAHPLTWYGWLSRRRLEVVAPKVADRVWAQAQQRSRRVKSLLKENAPLMRDPHVAAAIELMRLGLKTSAASELRAVKWRALAKKSKGVEPSMFQALLYHSVGVPNLATSRAMGDRQFGRYWPSGPNLERWRLAYPRPPAYRDRVTQEAHRQGISPSFVWAIMRSESRFNPNIQSPVLATGLLQLMQPTGKKMAKRLGITGTIDTTRLKDPDLNIRLGVGYMALLSKRLAAHPALIASGYNAGPGNTGRWLKARSSLELDAFVETIPFRENRRYVKSVITSAIRYAFLYDQGKVPTMALKLGLVRRGH